MSNQIILIVFLVILVIAGYFLILIIQSALQKPSYADNSIDEPYEISNKEIGFVNTAVVTAKVVSSNRSPITLTAVGDINLARAIQDIYKKHPSTWYLEDVKNELAGDVVFANLESVISDKGVDSEKTISFRAEPEMMSVLLDGGFDVVSVSNNHSYDWGREAFDDSWSRLKESGIVPVGSYLGKDIEITPYEVEGYYLGFMAITSLSGPLDREVLIEEIRKQNKNFDYLIISIHWGNEYKIESNDFQKTLAHEMVDAGADIILGHHPHVLEEVEEYDNKLIFYSLGNFLFDQWWSQNTMKGAIAKIVLNHDRSMSYELIRTNNYNVKVELGH